MSSIPFYLITGFLGSGKTTLLKRIVDTFAGRVRLAIIQNEFADANIDAKELRATKKQFEILEINKGSVFCVCLFSDFIPSLKSFVERCKPDAVILEATGLADPVAIGQMFNSSDTGKTLYLAGAWCIVDAATFIKMEATVGNMSRQVRIADKVIINKIDKAASNEPAVRTRIAEINPFAEIVSSSYCNVDIDSLLIPNPAPVAVKHGRELAGFKPCGRPQVKSVVIRAAKSVTRKALEEFLAEIGSSAYRIKGYANIKDGFACAVQATLGDISVTECADLNGPSEIVIIGSDIDSEALVKRFDEC